MSVESPVNVTEIMVESGTKLTLNVPEEKPEAVINALCSLFKSYKPIRRAFWVMSQHVDLDDEPVLLIALEVTEINEIDEIIQAAGETAIEHLQENESIDFCILGDENEGISHFILAHTEPFYQRKLGGWLRDSIPIVNQS